MTFPQRIFAPFFANFRPGIRNTGPEIDGKWHQKAKVKGGAHLVTTLPSGASPRRAAFTLLEVLLAVFILALISLGIHRFVRTTMDAVRLSTAQVRQRALMEAFANYLRSVVASLPPDLPGAISGEPHQFGEFPQDEWHWITGPGSSLLTINAVGGWTVTLTVNKGKLGIWRQDVDATTARTWLPLLDDIKGLEVRYFDTRTRQWVERWQELALRPALVRVRLLSAKNGPYEVMLQFPPLTPGAQPPNFSGAPRTPGAVPFFGPGAIPSSANRLRR